MYSEVLLTPWSRVLIEKPTGSQLVKKFPALYGTRNFITTFTSSRYLSLSSTLPLVLPSGLFPSGFPIKTLYTPVLSPIRATCPAHLILDLITRKYWVRGASH